MDHIHQHHSQAFHSTIGGKKENIMQLAISATLHCLAGCGIGEVTGMIIGAYFGMTMLATMLLAIVLGIVFGFALGIIPLLRRGISFSKTFKIVLVGEGLSIVVMEAFEVGTQLAIPGVMHASLNDPIFWIGMGAALVAGFLAALPVNYIMIKKGIRHEH